MPKLSNKQYALVAGGDTRYMTTFFDVLKARGFEVHHDDGRVRKKQLRKQLTIPNGVRLIIVITDRVGHNMQGNYKSLAKDSGLPIIYCRLCANELVQKLEKLCTKNVGLMKVSSPA
jgi:hypothetical protein